MRIKSSIVLVLFLTLVMASGAKSHDLLVDIYPTEGQVVSQNSFEAKLTFNNPLLSVSGETNAEYATQLEGSSDWNNHTVKVEDRVLLARVSLEEPGQYKVRWKVVSSDGHPISGESSFVLEIESPDPGDEEQEPSVISPNPNSSDPEPEGSLTGFYIGLAMVALGAVFAPVGLMMRRKARKP